MRVTTASTSCRGRAPKPFSAAFVERDRFLEFRFCGGSESRVHLRKPLRKSQKTAPASRVLSLPVSKASMRRSDSSAQAASRDVTSGDARDSQSTSISFALSPAED